MNARATTYADADIHATAARAAVRRLTLWIMVEVLGLCTIIYFGWAGVLQPVIAGGLVLRAATLGTWIVTFERALPGAPREARRVFGAGLTALVLSLLLVLDLVPSALTEAGWDALVGLVLTLSLLMVPVFAALALARSTAALKVSAENSLLGLIPVAMALVFAALLPTISPLLAPSPWIAPAATTCLVIVLGLWRVIPAAFVVGLIAVLVASALALVDDLDSRTFVSVPAAIALLVAGWALRGAFQAHAEALAYMAQALRTRDAPNQEDHAETGDETQPELLSEDEAMALVDRELGLSPEKVSVIEVSTAEAEAIREPFQLKSSKPVKVDEGAIADALRWGVLGDTARRLGISYLVLTVGGLFAAFLALTPLTDGPIARGLVHLVVAAFFCHQAWLASRCGRDGPKPRSPLAARALVPLAAVAALAFAARGLMGTAVAGPLGAIGGAAGWTLLALTLVHLRGFAVVAASEKLDARFQGLLKITLSLGLVGLMTGLHGSLAPGDMAWLGSPLRVGTGILAVGVMVMLAYVLHDARQHFEDHGVRLRHGMPLRR